MLKKNGAQRNSRIEALKIIAILMIIISHVVQTLSTKDNPYCSSGYYVNLNHSTNNPQFILLAMLRYCGWFGNTIFFVSSAWFFLNNDRVDKKKIILLLIDIWLTSMTILSFVFIIRRGSINGSLLLMAVFPTVFENNWYLSCYIIFYAIHPFLNIIIRKLSQKNLLRFIIISFTMYFLVAFPVRFFKAQFGEGTTFFASELIYWIVIYFIVAYFKFYSSYIRDSKPCNILLVFSGILGNCSLILATNYLGSNYAMLENSLQLWNAQSNPFILICALGMLHLAQMGRAHKRWINYISSLSLPIYLIHENLLLRTLYRPLIWACVYECFGYAHILVWTVLIVIGIFVLSAICSVIYNLTVHKLSVRFCNKVYPLLVKGWNTMQSTICQKL